jgi:LacI family transcriptional regulator
VPDIGNPTFQAMLSGLSKSAAADGYRVLVADSAEDPEEEAVLAVETRRACDGLVLCAPRMSDERLRTLLPVLRPVLLINRTGPRFDAPSLSVDYGLGIQHLAEHLYGLGHRHLAYLEGPAPSTSNQSGATAVLAYNDLVAVGLMSSLAELGATVPQDISVAGFDDIPLVRYVTPRLTTVSVPYGPLGTEAWKRLHALIKGDTPSHDVVFQPRLQPRDSTAAPALRVEMDRL